MLPEKILRKTDEILNSDESLKRYEIIGQILTNEYGYKLESHREDRGINYWVYIKDNINESNINMGNSYELNDLPSMDDTLRRMNKNILPLFLESFK